MVNVLDSVAGMFGGSEKEKTLDKTKKGIDEAKEMMEKEQISFNEAFEKAIMPRIVEDCTEAGKNEAETKEAVQKLKIEFQKMFLMESQEKADIDKFLDQASTLTGFEKIDDAKAALGPMGAFMEKNGGVSQWKTGLSQLVEWLRKDGKDSMMASAICFLFKIESKDEKMFRIMEETERLAKEKKWDEARKKVAEFQKLYPKNTWPVNQLVLIKKGESETPSAATAAAATETTGTPAEQLSEKQTKFVAMFKPYGLTLDPNSIEAGLEKLDKGGVKKENIPTLLSETMTDETGKLKKVTDKVKEALDGKDFTWNLADLLIESIEPDYITKVTEVIGEIGNKPAEIRNFLSKIEDETDTEVAIADYKKTQANG